MRYNTTKYCYTHGACTHKKRNCNEKTNGYKNDATFRNMMGGSTCFCQGCDWYVGTESDVKHKNLKKFKHTLCSSTKNNSSKSWQQCITTLLAKRRSAISNKHKTILRSFGHSSRCWHFSAVQIRNYKLINNFINKCTTCNSPPKT